MFTLDAKDLENSFEHKLERAYSLAETLIKEAYKKGRNSVKTAEILLFSETGNQILYQRFKDTLEQHGFIVWNEPSYNFRTGRQFTSIGISW